MEMIWLKNLYEPLEFIFQGLFVQQLHCASFNIVLYLPMMRHNMDIIVTFLSHRPV